MNRNALSLCSTALLLLLMVFVPVARAAEEKAIVLAVFGTSHPSALPGILGIRDQVRSAFPRTRIELAFTSNKIRQIWQERRRESNYRELHPEVPAEILNIKGPLAAIANLQDEGYDYIIVQPTHIASAEEFTDLSAYVAGLNSIRTVKARNMPFRKIILGRPALGTHGIEHEYRHDIELAAKALADDVRLAKAADAALVYMGHGNEHYSTGAYLEFEAVMRATYPETPTYVGMVEGFPELADVTRLLARDGVRRVYLKSFMTVAGDHAKNDMAGPEPDSWKSTLERQGLNVTVDLNGVGENPAFAEIFVQHIRDAAKDHGLELR